MPKNIAPIRPLQDIIRDLQQAFADREISQSSAAKACSLNQSQVSRILDGQCIKVSKGIQKLCIYASVNVCEGTTNYDPAKDASLMGALRVAVGNNSRRARQLERVMRALAEE